MDIAQVHWTGKRQFVGTDGRGHSVVMDATSAYGGEDSGLRPVAVLLHALAACSGMDVVSILEKKRQDVRDLTIEVRGEQRADEYPKIYTTIEMEYIVTGFDVNPEAVARAIELSHEKYCSVAGMLGDQTKLVTSYRVVDAPLPGQGPRGSKSGKVE